MTVKKEHEWVSGQKRLVPGVRDPETRGKNAIPEFWKVDEVVVSCAEKWQTDQIDWLASRQIPPLYHRDGER